MSLDSIVKVMGGEENIGRDIQSRRDFIIASREGKISSRVVSILQRKMGVTNFRMASILHISESTLQRLQNNRRSLKQVESEAAYEVSRVIAKGMEVFEDEEELNRWLNTENQALGNEKPIDWLDSSIGREQLMDLLTAIEYGHYS